MDYAVTHVTQFQYQGPVHESVMELRLSPRSDSRQEVLAFELATDPPAALFGYVDAFGNQVHHLDIAAPHQALLIEARIRVRTSAVPPLPDRLARSAWDALETRRAGADLWDFFEASPRVPLSRDVAAFAEALGLERAPDPLTSMRRIVSAVHGALEYKPDSTTVDTSVEELLESRRGVCQDFTHVALALARLQGIPCRYVSGYLAPDFDHTAGDNLMTHAWIEAWLPGLEWVSLDPTHDLIGGERHITMAVGRDYGDAAPTRGVFRGGPAGALSASVRIERADGRSSSGDAHFPEPHVVPAPAAARSHADQ